MFMLSCLASTLTAPVNAKAIELEFLRFNEDHAHLSQEDSLGIYAGLKYVPFSDTSYASFGGQYRAQYSYFDGARFGLTTPDNGSVLLHRFSLHGDFHYTDKLRTFLEIGSYHVDNNRLNAGPFDKDKINLQQAFLDIKNDALTLRVGRQETAFGSARLIGVRDGPNIRRSFDGVMVEGDFDGVKAQVFLYQEVATDDSNFWGDSNENEELWGLYTTWRDAKKIPTNIDFYYIGINRGMAKYAQGTGRDKRHTFGSRLFGSRGNWDWNYELIFQIGDFASADIKAGSIATITGYKFKDVRWSPRLSLSANLASGDDNPNDDRLNTFNPLFPNLYYFEEATQFAPQNFFNIEPGVTIQPHENLSLSLDWNFFWKHKKNDGVYTAGLFPLPNTERTDSRFVAHVPSLSIDWNISNNVVLDVSYSHFFAGSVIKDSGGKDVDFIKVELTILI